VSSVAESAVNNRRASASRCSRNVAAGDTLSRTRSTTLSIDILEA
jgi:hypothetical protein